MSDGFNVTDINKYSVFANNMGKFNILKNSISLIYIKWYNLFN